MDRVTTKYMAAMVGCALLGFFPFVRGMRVPLLGLFDLGIHELGHLLFVWAGDTVHFLAGSAIQVLVPLGLAGYFWLARRDPAASALLVAWAGASTADVAVYVADAPFERLQLIGGEHDWAHLLRTHDLMHLAGPLAAWTKGIGGLLVVGGMGLAAAGPWIEPRLFGQRSSSGMLQSAGGAADNRDDPWD